MIYSLCKKKKNKGPIIIAFGKTTWKYWLGSEMVIVFEVSCEIFYLVML